MKRFTKVLLIVILIAMFTVAFSAIASAQDTANTFAQMYIGDYQKGSANIVFGQVSNTSNEYGVIIKELSTGKVYSFEGKKIGTEGKFGVAIYNMPAGDYVAQVYSGDAVNGIFGAEVPFTADKANYTVTFYDENEEVIATQSVPHGASATTPDNEPFVKNSWFSGWDTDFSTVHTDLEIRPEFETSTGVSGLKVYKDANEDFKILNLADIQIINPETANGAEQVNYYPHYGTPDESAWNVVRDLIETNKPDLIVLNGDNIYSKFDDANKTMHRKLTQIIDSYNTPWTIIFGNHDGEIPSDTDFLLTDIVDIYSESDYFYFESKDGRQYGDFTISLVNKGTNEVVMRYFFMYTHYNSGWFNTSQVEWFEKESAKLNDGNKVIPSFFFAHIPVPELQDALIEKYHSSAVFATSDSNQVLDYIHVPENSDGDFGEYNGASYSKNYGMYDIMKKYGSTQLAIFGHEHSNNVSVDYNGIRLMYAMKTGTYAISDPNTHLNGGTVMNIDADGKGYSLTNDHYTDRSLNYTYSYDFNLEAPAKEEGIGYLKATGDDAVVSGANKITLSEGESASLSFDVYSAVIFHNSEKNASNPAKDDGSTIVQMGLKIQSSPITGPWQGGSMFLHWMQNGPAGAWTQTGNVKLPTYARSDIETYLFYNSVDSVFATGRSVKYTVYYDGTIKIFSKLASEGEDKWVELAYATSTVNTKAGFYLGFQTTRSMKFKNFKIDGSSYIINYNNAACTFTSLDDFDSYSVTYDDKNASATHHGSFFSKDAVKLSSVSDTVSMEFTMITPPSIDSANLAAFALVDSIPTTWIDTSDPTDYFWVYWNHVYMTKSGAGIVADSVENSFFDHSLTYNGTYRQWSGAYFFKSLIRYKFEVKGDKTFAIYAKNGLDVNAEYEKVYAGTVNSINLDNSYYIGFLFHDNFEVMDLVINGNDINNVNITNATIVNPNITTYNVTFYDEDNNILKTEVVEEGESATAPEVNPFKTSSWFSGWDTDFSEVYEDLDVQPVFKTSTGVDGLKVYKKANEDFKILNLADIQIINPNTENGADQVNYYPHYGTPDESAWNVVRDLIETNKPDLIVLNGDNIYSKFDDANKSMHRKLTEVIDAYHTPWTIIFGNHDGEIPSDTDFLLTDIVDIYSESDYFYFETEEGRQYGDFAISLVNKGTNNIVMKYFFMYTHYNTGWFNTSQVEWFEKESAKLNDGNKVIPSFFFAHIPVPELQDALIEKYHDSAVFTTSGSNQVLDYIHVPANSDGDFGEYNGASYSKNYGMYDIMKEYGSTQLAIFGHEHANNVSVDYNGIRLMYAMKTGTYAISDPNTHLNGGTVMNIDADGKGYSLTNDHYTDRSLNYTYSYDFNLVAPAKEEGIGYLKATGDDAVVSGANKITLSEGEVATLSFDVYSSAIFHNSEKNASNPAKDDGSGSVQMGLKIQSTPITGAWQGGSMFLHFMQNGPAGAWTQTGKVKLPTYARSTTETYLFNNSVDSVFARGRSIKYEIAYDGKVTMYTKLASEPDSKYVALATATSTVNTKAGFYLGFQTTRSMKFKNFKISGSSYVVNYNNVACTFTPLGQSEVYKVDYEDGNANSTNHGSFFSKNAVKLSSASDTVSMEFTMITPPYIDSANLAAFALVDSIPTTWIDTSDPTDHFWVYWNHVYMTKSGAGIVADSVENSFFDHTLTNDGGQRKWSGAYFFKSLIRYKFEVKGDKTFAIYAKNGLDVNAEYEKVYAGTLNSLDLNKSYYIGFIFHNDFEIRDLVINGNNINNVNVTNAIVTKVN